MPLQGGSFPERGHCPGPQGLRSHSRRLYLSTRERPEERAGNRSGPRPRNPQTGKGEKNDSGVLFAKLLHFIIYCITSECAMEAAKELDEHGYSHVEYVNGTLMEWKDKGYSTESLCPAYDWHD